MQFSRLVQKLALPVIILFCVSACTTVVVDKNKAPLLTVKANKVLILPVESLHKVLRKNGNLAYNALATEIQDRGFELVELSADTYQQIKENALEETGAVYDPSIKQFIPLNRGDYLQALIRLLKSSHDFDVVVVPELVLRTARVSGMSASWDDVERPIVILNKIEEGKPFPPTTKGLSLRISAYKPNSIEILTHFSGLSLPYDIYFLEGIPRLEIRETLYTIKELDESVTLAMKAFEKQVKLKKGGSDD